MLHLSQIFVYPVKSLRGIALSEAVVEPRGLAHDRRWMLVDADGMFFTQREFPEMTLLTTALSSTHLTIAHTVKPLGKLSVPLQVPADAPRQQVQIWDDTCSAVLVSAEADAWLSEALGTFCRLVYMPDDVQRPTEARFRLPGDMVSFADGYPLLIAGQASVDDLNAKLSEQIGINRFRPNLVFTGGTPFVEDHWRKIRIGEQAVFRGVKPCARCQLVTIDPETAAVGKEPLRTLATYRREGHKVLFGMNLCPASAPDERPVINVGDRLEVLESIHY
ncbi:MAG TPA: MOSC domain-containing protein [Saprospiraceae bacterium]|nr:MOSC domain-containing protein [Saprospiraceae bacterium]HMP23272.1 MOSC domain-containing protein [Saprospiraceae bacterium]